MTKDTTKRRGVTLLLALGLAVSTAAYAQTPAPLTKAATVLVPDSLNVFRRFSADGPKTLAFYGERVNNIDLRLAKIVRVKGTRANIGIDLYNLTTANTPTAVEATYDPASRGERWFRPTAVLQPRFMRVNVQFDF